MRWLVAIVAGLVFVSGTWSQAEKPDENKRHGVARDLQTYPQSTPQETLTSLLKAIDNQRIDYIVAHLADPAFVDRRLKDSGAPFSDLVREATGKLMDEAARKQLRRLLKEGGWEIHESTAVVRHNEIPERSVVLHKLDGRWFIDNRYKPEEKKSDGEPNGAR